MKFFIDTAVVEEIKALLPTGLVDGVTTNPSLVAKTGRKFTKVIEEICQIVEGPVSAEVAATDYDGMLKEGLHLASIASNVTVKLPLTVDGLKVCKALADKEIKTNVTLCFSPAQALLAAKAGASFISPFVGRLDDVGQDGLNLVSEILEIYSSYSRINTEVLVASVRTPGHIIQAAKMGADVATLPPSLLWMLYKHPLTDKGLETFLKDWAATGQSIL